MVPPTCWRFPKIAHKTTTTRQIKPTKRLHEFLRAVGHEEQSFKNAPVGTLSIASIGCSFHRSTRPPSLTHLIFCLAHDRQSRGRGVDRSPALGRRWKAASDAELGSPREQPRLIDDPEEIEFGKTRAAGNLLGSSRKVNHIFASCSTTSTANSIPTGMIELPGVHSRVVNCRNDLSRAPAHRHHPSLKISRGFFAGVEQQRYTGSSVRIQWSFWVRALHVGGSEVLCASDIVSCSRVSEHH